MKTAKSKVKGRSGPSSSGSSAVRILTQVFVPRSFSVSSSRRLLPVAKAPSHNTRLARPFSVAGGDFDPATDPILKDAGRPSAPGRSSDTTSRAVRTTPVVIGLTQGYLRAGSSTCARPFPERPFRRMAGRPSTVEESV